MEKQVALITGSTGGIGQAIARRLGDLGYALFLTGRNEEKLQALVEELRKKDVRLEHGTADLANEKGVEVLTDAFKKVYDRLDVLVNNAGMALSKPFAKVTVEDWELIMRVNARAPFFLTQALAGMMKGRGEGVIINISSVVGRLGYPQQSAYGASKHALHGFSKVLAKELQPHNIRVHVIAPGGVDTELVENMRPDIAKDKLMHPDEIAEIVAFLVRLQGNAVIDEINVRRKTSQPWQ